MKAICTEKKFSVTEKEDIKMQQSLGFCVLSIICALHHLIDHHNSMLSNRKSAKQWS